MIEVLKRLSPVPIEFVFRMSEPCYEGMFFYRNRCLGHPLGRIEILDNLLPHEKIATLAHEIGHALCYEKDCKCLRSETIKENHTLTEIHAYKYTLSWLLKNKQKQALIWEMERIEKNVLMLDIFGMEYYAEAAQHIMKLKLWQKCLDYIK